MSKTFASRPTVSRTRNPTNNRTQATGAIPKQNTNRGRGTRTSVYPNSSTSGRGMSLGAANGMGRGAASGIGRGSLQTSNHLGAENNVEQPPVEQRMSYQGGYTMITPNEKKKQQIQQQAERETRNYQEHKERQKIGHLSYVGTAGGGQISQQEARSKLIQDNRNPGMRLREKREEYRTQQKKKEEEEMNQKRERQRQLAQKNQTRSFQTDAEKKNKWDEDRRRKTDQFLSKLENKSSQGANNMSANPSSHASQNRPPRQLFDQHQTSQSPGQRLPAHVEPNRFAPGPSSAYNEPDFDLAVGGIQLNRSVPNDIDRLHNMFPGYDREALEDILRQTGSLDAAIDMLS